MGIEKGTEVQRKTLFLHKFFLFLARLVQTLNGYMSRLILAGCEAVEQGFSIDVLFELICITFFDCSGNNNVW